MFYNGGIMFFKFGEGLVNRFLYWGRLLMGLWIEFIVEIVIFEMI